MASLEQQIQKHFDEIDALQKLIQHKASWVSVSLLDVFDATWNMQIQGFIGIGFGIHSKLLSDRGTMGVGVDALKPDPTFDEVKMKRLNEHERFSLFIPDQKIKIDDKGESLAEYFVISRGEFGSVMEEKINVVKVKFNHPLGSGLEYQPFTTVDFLRQKK